MSFKDKNEPQDTSWNKNPVTAPNRSWGHEDEDEIPERDRKAHVNPYENTAEFPFEKDEIVWIVKPEYRAPLGQFRIAKAHPNDTFELVRCSDNTPHSELVEGKHLRRNI